VKTAVQNKQKEDEFGLEMLQRGIQSGAREDYHLNVKSHNSQKYLGEIE
jgi:hypothetical protein